MSAPVMAKQDGPKSGTVNIGGDLRMKITVICTFRGQASNRRNSPRVTINGETKTLIQWCRQFGVRYKTVHRRMMVGWPQSDWFLPSWGEPRTRTVR